MPRCVRNFWCEVNSDARKNPVKTGPIGKDRHMTIKLYVRQSGQISPLVLHVDCIPHTNEMGARKNRVIVYFDGPEKLIDETVDVNNAAKQLTYQVDA